MSLARKSKQYLGVRAALPPDLQTAKRNPLSTDTAYVPGTLWMNTVGLSAFMWSGTTWIDLGSGILGAIDTLTASSGGAISPSGGNINLLGTANQITTAGAGSTITFTIPVAFIAPGSIASTTTLTSGTSLAVTTSATVGTTLGVTGATTLAALTQVGTANINASGAAVTIIGTGGTGAVNIGNATGNTAVTGTLTTSGAMIVSAGGLTVTGTTNINASGSAVSTIGTGGTGAVNIGNATGNTAVTGSLTASTGLVATTGGLLVSGGDIINSHSDAGTDVTIEVTNSDNTNGASRAGVEIATGGASSGDPYLSFQISGVAASTMTMGLDNSASDLFVISNNTALGTTNALTLSQAGALNATTSVTAGTTLTATLGAITATNGNLVLGTAGNKILSTSVGSTTTAGANSFGTVALSSGSAVVNTTAAKTASLIFISCQALGTVATPMPMAVTARVDSTSFTITSSDGTDTSTVAWFIVN